MGIYALKWMGKAYWNSRSLSGWINFLWIKSGNSLPFPWLAIPEHILPIREKRQIIELFLKRGEPNISWHISGLPRCTICIYVFIFNSIHLPAYVGHMPHHNDAAVETRQEHPGFFPLLDVNIHPHLGGSRETHNWNSRDSWPCRAIPGPSVIQAERLKN